MSKDFEAGLKAAVRHFWAAQVKQSESQGSKTGKKDAGRRAAVTAGKQFDALSTLIEEDLRRRGVPDGLCFRKRSRVILPGFYRPNKQWDLVIVQDGNLLASLELKSHVGSFGNNANNRAEEAIGNATDYWTAVREGAFGRAPQLWLGYLILLEDSEASRKPLNPKEPHFKVFPEFRGASYMKRYEILCAKMVRERLYNSACFIVSPRENGAAGAYSEPCMDLSFGKFLASLTAHVVAHAKC